MQRRLAWLARCWRAFELAPQQAVEFAALNEVHRTREADTEVLLGAVVEAAMKSAAALRTYGDDLVPEEVTRLLECAPTSAERKGQVIRTPSGRERTARTGGWDLVAPDSEPEGLDQQVSWLLGQMTGDLKVWHSLVGRYRIDLFCGLFMLEMKVLH